MTAPTIRDLVPDLYNRATRCCLDAQPDDSQAGHAARSVILCRHAHYHEGRDDHEVLAELEQSEQMLRRVAPDHELLAGE